MLKKLIDQLTTEALKKKIRVRARLSRTHFLAVWCNGDRMMLELDWTSGMLDGFLVTAIRAECPWEEFTQEIGAHCLLWSGKAPEVDAPSPAAPKREGHFITRAQQVRMLAIAGSMGLTHADVKVIVERKFNAKSTLHILPPEYDELCDVILPAGRAYLDSVNWYRKEA